MMKFKEKFRIELDIFEKHIKLRGKFNVNFKLFTHASIIATSSCLEIWSSQANYTKSDCFCFQKHYYVLFIT